MLVKILDELNNIHGVVIAFFFLIPIVLLILKKHQWLVVWMVLTCIVEIFAYQRPMPLTAFKIAGLILIPWCCYKIKDLISSKMSRLFWFYLFIVMLVTAYFVYISPWEDTTGIRKLFERGPQRAMKQLGTILGELATVFYVGWQIRSHQKRELLLKTLFIICFIDILGIFLSCFFQYDFYSYFTGADIIAISNRFRGFNYEPRGAAQVATYAFLLLWNMNFKWVTKFIIGQILLLSIFLAVSLIAILIICSGILFLVVGNLKFPVLVNRENVKAFLALLIINPLLIGGIFFFSPHHREVWADHQERRKFVVNASTFVGHFEFYDSTALNFFINRPSYLLLGVGAGQAGLAGTPFMLDRDKKKFRHKNKPRVDNLPGMGWLYQLSTVGFIGLGVLLWGLITGGKSLWRAKEEKTLIFYVLFILIYLMQMRYIYPFIWALGMSASWPQDDKIEA